MIRKNYIEKILEIKPRNEVYNFLKNNPGMHFREISRSLDIPASTLKYHLRYLEKKGFLSKQSEHGYLRFYLYGKIGKNDKKLLSTLRETVPRNILLYLILCMESSQKELIEFAEKWKNHPSKIGYHLNKHRTTIGFHLKKLLEEDILIADHDGTEIMYRINNIDEILDLIIRYDTSVLMEAYGRFLKYVDDSHPRLSNTIDNVAELFDKLFPPPFRS